MTVEYKVCTKCGESKPATAEFFYATKNNKAGVESACKVCYRTRSSVNTVKRGRVYLIWAGVMGRCYTQSSGNYKTYGGKGVTVCEEWKNPDIFIEWYNKHNIKGWQIDKDIVGTGDCYSPENCVFVPNTINMFFTFRKQPSIRKIGRKCYISYQVKGESLKLSGDTQEDVLEQFYLFKELYLEKLVREMKEEHKRLCTKYPTTPQISPKLLNTLHNFSTEEYLR